MALQIRHTNVFTKNWDALNDTNIRFIINQGGTRSSKTYSLCQMSIVWCLQNKNKVLSVVRKSFPALRGSVMRDFFEIMRDLNLYDEASHNKTENIYRFPNGSCIEFFSLDDAQKVRGRKRDILWAEEANELSFEEYSQLNFRTSEKCFFSFNPSDTEHWLYDIIEKPDAVLLHSTYKDNSFLSDGLIKEIEGLIEIDQDYYNIYALGLPSKSTHTIYTHQQPYIEPLLRYDATILGLDFGHVHPTALIRVDIRENIYHARELIYETQLTTEELIQRIKDVFQKEALPMSTQIVADWARPEIIEEIRRGGFNIHNAIKNVKEGIDAVKSVRVFYHHDSVNLHKEFRNYKWKSIGDKLIDEPVKAFDDALDALRYAILFYKKNTSSAGSWDFEAF